MWQLEVENCYHGADDEQPDCDQANILCGKVRGRIGHPTEADDGGKDRDNEGYDGATEHILFPLCPQSRLNPGRASIVATMRLAAVSCRPASRKGRLR